MRAEHANKCEEDILKLLQDIIDITNYVLIKQCNNNNNNAIASKDQIKRIHSIESRATLDIEKKKCNSLSHMLLTISINTGCNK